ncbi:hypothetical protein P152DRAFT_206996 [Eremomyces bilateralis CBS 781.70]|uniref:AA9 family lytic polysaccharide monooxygenase n=1 Tax=Eremomyces bilateralis CBS 781.70 TaxID=1392243 RepID=A0A6G1FSP4_9PEZI|nr:uncharacterized protein P152DRAFT_206996 [Eremomyces bilateralis CBS 781.70]KAF1808885.1 hypothetical protein P152DRAFT_206996 [Eremomyces bilateralis CBS 781.70]
MRMSNILKEANFPVSPTSEDVACNVNGKNGVSRTAPVKDGDTLSFECRSNMPDVTNTGGDGPIAVGHYGPCAIYAKKVDSAIEDQGVGPGWFKLWEDGYDESSGKWCNERFIESGGLLSVTLPQGLQGGDYLFRPEILALHNANQGDPQFFTGCAQVHLESTGNLVAKDTVSIPGWVSTSDPGVAYDLYKYPSMDLPYPIPGPPIVELVPGDSTASTSSVQTTGLLPSDCILENNNWCGKEVPTYNTQDGCWASAQNCWDQNDVCWDTAGPTGGHGCEIWGDYCKTLGDLCENKNFNGPPNAGNVLTPQKRTISPKFWGSGEPIVGAGAPSATPVAKAPVAGSQSSAAASPTADAGSGSGSQGGEQPAALPAPSSSQYFEPAPSNVEPAQGNAAPAPSQGPVEPAAVDGDVVTVTVTAYTTVVVDQFVTVSA